MSLTTKESMTVLCYAKLFVVSVVSISVDLVIRMTELSMTWEINKDSLAL
jgi:hypothetical protein